MDFIGRERIGLQLSGTLPTAAVRDCTGGNVPLDDEHGRVSVRLNILALEDVRQQKVPLKFTYAEALWRVGVIIRKKPAWLIIKVDVDRPLVRTLVNLFMSYPTRAARIDIRDAQRMLEVGIHAGTVALTVRAELNTSPPVEDDKRQLVTRHGARFFKIPWGRATASSRQGAIITMQDTGLAAGTLGDGVTWDEAASVWRGREHECGSAAALDLI